MNLRKYCCRTKLELQDLSNKKFVMPKLKFILFKEKKVIVFRWINELRMIDDYASNLHGCIKENSLNEKS